MGSFQLPSGRVVELKDELTYGDECKVIFTGLNDTEAFHFAKFAAICPSLTRADIEALSREDGRALAVEVNRRFLGRAESDEIPFEKTSPSSSADTKAPSDPPQPAE